MLWLCGNSFMPGGTGSGRPRAQAVLGNVEAHDLVDALDADIGHAALLGERSVSYQPRLLSGLPSGPRIGAISASAIAIGTVPR